MKTNLKPFDLQEALSGEPVLLRNGSKAYVRHHETELSISAYETLIGYQDNLGLWSWSAKGTYAHTGCESPHDIIGMYPRSRTINEFEVPVPEKNAPELGTKYYTPEFSDKEFYLDFVWDGAYYDIRLLERGLVFTCKEDAVANAKAMIGIDPYQKETTNEVPFKDEYTLEQVIGDTELSDWIRWVALDEDGEVYGYSDRPYLSPYAGTWDTSNDGSLAYIKCIDPPADFTTCVWQIKE